MFNRNMQKDANIKFLIHWNIQLQLQCLFFYISPGYCRRWDYSKYIQYFCPLSFLSIKMASNFTWIFHSSRAFTWLTRTELTLNTHQSWWLDNTFNEAAYFEHLLGRVRSRLQVEFIYTINRLEKCSSPYTALESTRVHLLCFIITRVTPGKNTECFWHISA